MRTFLVLSAVVAAVLAGPAAPPRPSGRLILLPSRQQHPPPAEGAVTTTPAPTTARRHDTDITQTEKLLDAGEYYVLTPEGKLQMVKYTTAALKSPTAQVAQVAQQPEPFAQFQVEYFQFPSFEVPQAQPALAQTKTEEDPQESSGFEANVQFRDVKPIPAPIYAFNPAPAVRILRK